MPLSNTSSQDTLQPFTPSEDHHHHIGRYVVGGTVLVVTLLILHHVVLRDASKVAGICIHAIIMMSYILWVLYSARREKLKARGMTSTMQQQQLTEVISDETVDMSKRGEMSGAIRETLEDNPSMTSVQGRPVMLSSTKARQIVGIHRSFNQDPGTIT